MQIHHMHKLKQDREFLLHVGRLSLIPTPSHHPIFDRLQYAKMEGGRSGYHVNAVSVYLGTQRGEGGGGVADQKNLRFEPGVVCFSLCKHSKLQLGQKLQNKASGSFF